jgi:hypothetical protein
MTLDDVMEIWRSQDASPLHGVNEKVVRLALQQDEARLQRARRGWRWFTYVVSALVVQKMARDLFIMINRDQRAFSGWDYAIPVVGAAAAMLWVRLMYARQRAQALREQAFGDSLRDQINRQLTQLESGARMSRLAGLIGIVLLPIVWSFTTILASWRINDRSFSDPWLSLPVVFMICWSILMVGGALWWMRRVVQRKTLPRKRRLEELLREVDGA